MTSNIYLLDSSVLIALADENNTLHHRAVTWFKRDTPFATCPITQGALLRFYMRQALNPSVRDAKRLLEGFTALKSHHFWPDDIGYQGIPEKGVTGHRQITDVYLVALAKAHHGILATLDRPLAAVHPGVLLI